VFVVCGGESDLRSIEEFAAIFFGNRAEENALRDAGDEIEAAIGCGERGHGCAIGFASSEECGEFAFVGVYLGAKSLFPGFETVRDGRVRKGWVRFVDRASGCACWVMSRDHKNGSPLRAKRSGRGVVDAGADACLDVGIYFIVRQKGVIIGKVGEIRCEGSGIRKRTS